MERSYYKAFIVPVALSCRLFIKCLAICSAQRNVRTTVAETFKLELSNKCAGLLTTGGTVPRNAFAACNKSSAIKEQFRSKSHPTYVRRVFGDEQGE
jgi:hypothetical protein